MELFARKLNVFATKLPLIAVTREVRPFYLETVSAQDNFCQAARFSLTGLSGSAFSLPSVMVLSTRIDQDLSQDSGLGSPSSYLY